jgi:hypothetical protein
MVESIRHIFFILRYVLGFCITDFNLNCSSHRVTHYYRHRSLGQRPEPWRSFPASSSVLRG